jgi:hypothetical protein
MTPSRLGQDNCDASGRSMRLYRYRFVLLALLIFVLGIHLIQVPSDWPILFVPVSIGRIIYLGTRKK